MSEALYQGYHCTPLQVDYLRYIVTYAQDYNGNSPTIATIAKHFGVAFNTAKGHIFELSNRRLLRIDDGQIVVEESVWEPPAHVME